MIFATIISCKRKEGNYHGGILLVVTYSCQGMEFFEGAEGISEKMEN